MPGMSRRPAASALFFVCLSFLLAPAEASAQQMPRARDLGIPFDGTPGPLNAITDVAGVEVGQTTLISGTTVRTGVTAVLPRGKASDQPVFAGWFSLNGNGEMTGTTWIEEAGFLSGPVFITNTHSVGVVHAAAIEWAVTRNASSQPWSLPVVAETWDGGLNDINGFHVKPAHVFSAIEGARGGAVPEGNTGGGTGMICYEFKCGTGTASRRVSSSAGVFTVGVLVQANHGARRLLRVAGAPVGAEMPRAAAGGADAVVAGDDTVRPSKSIIIVVATDAPLLPHQLKRLARRASLGLARTGSVSSDSSGDIFIAFSTAGVRETGTADTFEVSMLSSRPITALFEATVQATEEAIINALVAAETMTGADGQTVEAISHQRLREVLQKYGRLTPG